MTRWQAFCATFRSVVLRRGSGRHLVRALTPPAVSEDTAPFPAIRNPYPQEPTP